MTEPANIFACCICKAGDKISAALSVCLLLRECATTFEVGGESWGSGGGKQARKCAAMSHYLFKGSAVPQCHFETTCTPLRAAFIPGQLSTKSESNVRDKELAAWQKGHTASSASLDGPGRTHSLLIVTARPPDGQHLNGSYAINAIDV